jgi:hypothetical protein
MGRALQIDVFAEDRAHEEFLRPLVQRILRENGAKGEVNIRAARGGYPNALREYKSYQQNLLGQIAGMVIPDILVVAIDANCHGATRTRQAVAADTHAQLKNRCVAACPDPHIERWYMADTEAFQHVVGCTPKLGRMKCERGRYKRILTDAIVQAGHIPLLGGIEFASEIVDVMDFYKAGKSDSSLKYFVTNLVRLIDAARS